MDTRERYQIDDETLQTLADAVQGRIHTMIPVRVMKDSDGHTVGLQPLIKWVQRMPDGSQKLNDYPPIMDAPVNFVSGGGTTFTHPIKKNDEGYALVASRSIDVWHEKGGEQPQVDARMHDLSDAIYCPGLRSTPRKLKDVSTNSAQMRSDDGKHFSDLNPTTGTITHSVDGGKHVSTVSKADGITHSAEHGKHVVSLTHGGISLKTAMGLALDASKGLNVKGAMKVDGKLTSTSPIGGSIAAGILGGGIGALVGAVAVLGLLAGAYGPSQGIQTVRYALNAAWVR